MNKNRKQSIEDEFYKVKRRRRVKRQSSDLDSDGVVDNSDNCPNVPNSDQLDTDSDGNYF